jgi:hypothetical protein
MISAVTGLWSLDYKTWQLFPLLKKGTVEFFQMRLSPVQCFQSGKHFRNEHFGFCFSRIIPDFISAVSPGHSYNKIIGFGNDVSLGNWIFT